MVIFITQKILNNLNMKVLHMFVLVLLSTLAKSQTIEISFSLIDSCVVINRPTNGIQITVSNNTDKNTWVNLLAINFTVFSEGKFIKQIDEMNTNEIVIVEFYDPMGNKLKNGFLLVRKGDTTMIRNYTGLFKNYQFDKNREYTLNGYYENNRKRIFKRVFNDNMEIGNNNLRVCE